MKLALRFTVPLVLDSLLHSSLSPLWQMITDPWEEQAVHALSTCQLKVMAVRVESRALTVVHA